MTSLIEKIEQSQKIEQFYYSEYLRSLIGKQFSFKGNIYTIEAVTEDLKRFIFNGCDELTTQTVLKNLIN